MSEIRIEKADEGQLLYDPVGSSSSETTFIKGDMDTEIEAYWGSFSNEKRFMIPFWRVEMLVAKSDLKEIALKVSNIEYPTVVDAEFISFTNETYDNISNETVFYTAKDNSKQIIVAVSDVTPKEDESYFVFGEALLTAFKGGFADEGTQSADQSLNARIGRTVNGLTIVYFILAKDEMHLDGGSSGGESNSCGAKIPPR